MAKGTKTGGRKKGTPNKVTQDVRACIRALAEGLAPEVESWIRRGAKKSPLQAARVYAGILEYHVPKLQRIEHTGDGGGPLEVRTITRRVVKAKPAGNAQ